MWLDIQDFNMLDGLASQFIAKYVGPYEIVVKPHPNVYMLKLPTSLWHTHGVFMFQSWSVRDEKRPNLKQKMWLEITVIKHMLVNEIENIIQAKEMCLVMK